MRPICSAVLCSLLVPFLTSCATAGVGNPGPAAVEDEARRFMAGYAADLLSHDRDAIAARYSRRGAHVVFPGDWNLEPHDSIARMYCEGWQGPESFEWQDLSYDVLGDDVVAVIGGFRFEADDNSGFLGTYTALLVREDGELRIRLENESWDNLPPPECAAQEGSCDLPLERAALEQRITASHALYDREPGIRQTALKDTIMTLTDELAASWSRLEPEDYLARFSDDLVFYIQGSRLARDGFSGAVREMMGSVRESSFEVLDPEVEVLGPDAAVISFQWRETTLDADGSTADQAGVLTLVYERRESEWLVIRAHESLRPAP